MKLFVCLLISLSLTLYNVNISSEISEKKTVEFPSKDGLLITADLYEVPNAKETILLCHQAGYSRGEYINTALELNKMGYSCLAIDQRSGKGVNSIKNETVIRATKKGLGTTYLDVKQDIESAIDYLFKKNGEKPLLIVGSSYSASLVLLIGKENEKVKAVAAFSPGEYLKGVKVGETISGSKKPIFVTASKSEIPKAEELTQGISQDYLTLYRPNETGIHGSRALWKTTDGSTGYWNAFSKFLTSL